MSLIYNDRINIWIKSLLFVLQLRCDCDTLCIYSDKIIGWWKKDIIGVTLEDHPSGDKVDP